MVYEAVATGWSASINSSEFYACHQCGACVLDTSGSTINRERHSDWHGPSDVVPDPPPNKGLPIGAYRFGLFGRWNRPARTKL